MAILWDVPEVLTDANGGVTKVRYSVSDGLAFFEGSLTFTPDPTSATYVGFSTLTKTEVVDWVKAELTQEGIDAAEASVNRQLAQADTTEYPTPSWYEDPVAVNKAKSNITSETVPLTTEARD